MRGLPDEGAMTISVSRRTYLLLLRLNSPFFNENPPKPLELDPYYLIFDDIDRLF